VRVGRENECDLGAVMAAPVCEQAPWQADKEESLAGGAKGMMST
jgi:hypothetical protein